MHASEQGPRVKGPGPLGVDISHRRERGRMRRKRGNGRNGKRRRKRRMIGRAGMV